MNDPVASRSQRNSISEVHRVTDVGVGPFSEQEISLGFAWMRLWVIDGSFFLDRGPLLGPRPRGELAPRSRKFSQGKTCWTLFSYPKWFNLLWNLTSSCLHSFHSFPISTKHTFCNQHIIGICCCRSICLL